MKEVKEEVLSKSAKHKEKKVCWEKKKSQPQFPEQWFLNLLGFECKASAKLFYGVSDKSW